MRRDGGDAADRLSDHNWFRGVEQRLRVRTYRAGGQRVRIWDKQHDASGLSLANLFMIEPFHLSIPPLSMIEAHLFEAGQEEDVEALPPSVGPDLRDRLEERRP